MIEIYRKINKEETLVASVPDDNATLEKTLMGGGRGDVERDRERAARSPGGRLCPLGG